MVRKHDEIRQISNWKPFITVQTKRIMSLKVAESAPDGGMKRQNIQKFGITEQQPWLRAMNNKGKWMTNIWISWSLKAESAKMYTEQWKLKVWSFDDNL